MPNEAEISDASASDAGEISAFSIKTYTDAFGADFRPDELAHHLERSVSVKAWLGYLGRDRVLLARQGGRLVGFVQAGPTGLNGEIKIRRLYVDAAEQNRGIGTSLLRHALALPMVTQAAVVSIDVWQDNGGARRLYERFGFRHEGDREPFYLSTGELDGYDLVLVRRRAERVAE